jgi:hypothetical protein
VTKLALSPRETALAFGIPHWRLRRAIKEGELVAHGIARRSVILIDDTKNWIRKQPATKSSKPSEVTS